MADKSGRAIDDGESWRDLPDGLLVLDPEEVRRVWALLAALGVEGTIALLGVSAEALEACCAHGAPAYLLARVRERFSDLDRRNPGFTPRGRGIQ